jgi:hypothetical protein
MLGVSYLDEPLEAIEQRKYRHPFCRTCIRNNLQYAPAELDPSRALATPRREPDEAIGVR